ncbi:MAG: DUF3644 domain-containing protein [Rhodothermaceae bacterium]|nr:DUF3644 domain-containing protein [Rhodothermaceae bacterium]MYE63486.1 DUF3644 domain-containing protein [Rhodothermaceae bacterium]MYJ20204.1 DUF3644 domain-containing protein [Rhodothermaceae bacterium]
MVNAWDLLLKARILQENEDNIQSIVAHQTINGRKKPKTNKSGNAITVGVSKAATIVVQYESDKIDQTCVRNLDLLIEIRDNAMHFVNASNELSYKVYQIGSAALNNFLFAAREWFQLDFSQYNMFLMPLAFNLPSGIIESIGGPEHSAEVQSFLNLVAEVERDNSADDSADYYLTVKVDLKFVRTPDSTAIRVKNVKNDSGAAKIELTEDQLMDKYPWDYKELVEQLKSRYSDFKQNERFHRIKRRCEENPDLCFVRYLDHRNQKGGKKKLYNPAMLNHFDSHYTKI